MTEAPAPISPLRRRKIEDMTIRKFAPRTQEGYIRAVKGFSAFLACLEGSAFLALGSDTAGSVRIPACMTGETCRVGPAAGSVVARAFAILVRRSRHLAISG
jgi:hypothetical protein